MTINLEMREMLMLLLAWLGFMAATAKFLLAQFDRRLDGRFAAMEQARVSAQQQLDKQLTDLVEQNRREVQGWQQLERDFLGWKADLPIQYVRREDYVRNQTVIEAKLDGLRLSIENQYLKGKTA